MSFTLTNQSLIRLESSKDEDEWNRTLMFFNVDISGGVCRDHQNKITQPRSSVCNGKRRAPGGGLANPITESVMSFGAANKFYARGHSNFDHGNYTPRTSGRRRDNFAYSDRRRHFHYRPIKSGRSRAAMGLVSPSPSSDSTGYYESKRIHYADFETGKTFDSYYPDEPYELEEDEPHRVVSTSDYTKQQEDPRANKEYEDGRYEYYPHGPRSTNRHHREPKRYYRYPFTEHPTQDDYHRDFRGTVPRQLRSSSYRMKQNCRQASGSLPPNYASNCYPHDSTEYGSDNDYDESPENYKNYRDYFEEPTTDAYKNPYEEFHDYEYPDYKKTSKAPPIPFPKPQPKYYKSYSKTPSPNYPTKIYKPERESKVNEVEVSPYEEAQTRHVKSNRIKQNNHPEEIPRRKGFNYVKERREDPIEYDKISKDISRPAQHEKYPSKVQDDRFTMQGNSHRERSISSTHRKIFKEELPHKYRPKKVINETREPHRNLRTKSVGQYDRPNGEYDSYKTRSHHKSSPDRKKSVDFVRLTDLNDGSEIPHKIRENGQSPSSIFFTIEIPYKKKHRRFTYPQKEEYISKRSHSGCDNFAPKSFRPQTSLYDVGKGRKRKTMKQKISGFFKRSKLCLSKSNIFRSKSKLIKNCKPAQRNLNCAQISHPSPDYSVNAPIASNYSLQSENVEVPSQESEHQKYGIKRGKECHYPTVYRGTNKQLPENNNEIFHQYSMFNVLSSTNQRSKVNNDDYDHYDPGLSKRTSRYFRPTADSPKKSSYKEFDRVSSGNCSLYKEGISGDPIGKSEINVCLTIRATDVSLTGSPRIVSSKIVEDRGLSCKSNSGEAKVSRSRPAIRLEPRQSSGSTICESASGENQFKNVRFSSSHFTHNSCSSTQSSSESNSSRIQTSIHSEEHILKKKSIEASSKPPEMPARIGSSSEHLPPRHRHVTKWSLTSQSKSYNSRPEPNPSRPGLRQPYTIEMCSRPPTLFQSDITKRSSLKRVDNNLEKSVPKKVVLKTNSSESMISGSMCSSGSSAKSLCTWENQDTKNDDRSECHRSQSHNFQFGEARKIEVIPRKTSSWPRQNLRSFPRPPIWNTDTKPLGKATLSPKTSTQSLESSISRCSSGGLSGNNEEGTSHKPNDMQLVCYPDDDPNLTNSCQSQGEYGSRFTAMRGLDITESANRGDLCCPKLVSDLERESFCPKSIVEELKRELLQTFRAEQQIRSQSPFLRPTPQIMIFPCVPSVMCQPRANMNPSPNLFPRPESEMCWIPSSKPQNPAQFN
ncbi:uncharacterized protein LOC117150498 isoform X1 [Drosophila mauritiana]|uniref:Uncharacterized protein LOC117150498 isoform X1 n=1 Tax=Drosophila mauritiana TaxID=7226 RepID=A0A6P8L5S4_DROMA|nr:uncharacterized protein LOC117150498 isoform X1 [Drosophila mauritiana]